MTTQAILDNLITQTPQTAHERYIFLLKDNSDFYSNLCKRFWKERYIAIQTSAEWLIGYLDGKICNASTVKDFNIVANIKNFVWVLCMDKDSNETLINYLNNEDITFRLGWRLMKRLTDTPSNATIKTELDKFTKANANTTEELSHILPEPIPTSDECKPHNTKLYIDNLLMADIEKMKKAGNRKTGFPVLDKLSKGLYPGLYVIAAASSLGKTTFSMQIADNLAMAGNDVLFFTLEQSRLDLIAKSFSRFLVQDRSSLLSSHALKYEDHPNELNVAIDLYKDKISDRMSIIEGNFGLSVDYIESYVKTYISNNNCSPVVFIDYLQILQPPTALRTMGSRETIDQTVTALKRLSRDYDLTIFVISSINRSNYLQPIDFESLKESGGIEYTADVIWGLQLQCLNNEIFGKNDKIKEKRELIKKAKSENPRQIELVCLKNRYGIANFTCTFEYRPNFDLYTQEPNDL